MVRTRMGLVPMAVCALAAAAAGYAKDRTKAWEEDLIVARDVFLQKDRSYSSEARRAARSELERTRKRIERLTDQQIVGSLARAAALSDNAHTRAYLLRNRSYWRRYPLRIWRFPDGWYVVAARREATALAGARITHIGGTPIEHAFERVRKLYAGNAGWSAYMSTYTLTSPDALLSVGVIADDAAEFRVHKEGARISARLHPESLDRRTGPEESWWFLSPQHPATSGWSHVLAERSLPQLLISPEQHYTSVRCAGDVLYIRYSRSADAPAGETVRAFGEKVFAAIAARPTRKLVLDLRFNTGGNLQLAQPLIEGLAHSELGSRSGGIAVLVGPATFSAGITAAASLRAGSRAILVGTHPGDRPDYWAEGGNVTLPNSGLVMHYADELHHYSAARLPRGVKEHLHLDLNVRDLEPDVRVDWTWKDYLSGSDPVATAGMGAPLRCDVSMS